MDALDNEVRRFVYHRVLARGVPPSLADAATSLGLSPGDVTAAFRRLAANRVLVLQPDTDEILMASPFSAVPTPFLVELDAFTCYANCIWDALGVPAMTKQDARIKTSCGDCGAALELAVAHGALQAHAGVIHFAVPARNWWDDIVFN